MTITVKIDGCQGHGLCYGICPEVFVPDVEGYATGGAEAVPTEFESAAREAAEACPERAISVIEA